MHVLVQHERDRVGGGPYQPATVPDRIAGYAPQVVDDGLGLYAGPER